MVNPVVDGYTKTQINGKSKITKRW